MMIIATVFLISFIKLLFTSVLYSEESKIYDFTIGRIQYDGGGDWYSDPSSLPNLLKAVRDRLGLHVSAEESVVKPSDQTLYDHPFLYLTGHGNISFSPAEVKMLRAYFERGGFLWADDNYGMDESFRREIAKVFPDSPLVELPFSHPIYHTYYPFQHGLPKIHEHDGGPPHGYGIFLNGRLAVFYSFNTDIGDGLESEGVHDDPPQLREEALKMALNIVLFSLNN